MKTITLVIIAVFIMNPGLNVSTSQVSKMTSKSDVGIIQRIVVTVLGIVIIMFQGITTIVMIGFSAVNLYTSYFGIAPPESKIRPKSLVPAREKYVRHIKTRSIDIDPPPKAAPSQPVVPSFSVADVRRYPKIDDEYDDQVGPLFSGSSRRGTPIIPPGARLSRQAYS